MQRREYNIRIKFNSKQIVKVIVDPHFELKHAESITDEIILALVKMLNGLSMISETVTPPYSYFMEDMMELNGKFYKLIWVIEDDQMYIGVVNAYRRK